MQCPVCQLELKMVDRQGVEIDYCPKCRGVWLDRGELDKLIERAAPSPRSEPEPAPWQREPRHDYRGYDRDDDYDDYDRFGRRGRRRGWLGDIFDFD